MQLLYTGTDIERWVDPAEEKLRAFQLDSGYWYLKPKPPTPTDAVAVEDLGVTLLMNSQMTRRKRQERHRKGYEINPLSATVASWYGFGSSWPAEP